MASQPSDSKKKKQKNPKKRVREDSELLKDLDSHPWNSSLPEIDDAFSYLFGDDELEGGLLSLEEVDETTYGMEISKSSGGNEQPKSKGMPKTKKQKISESHDDSNGEEGDDKSDEEIKQNKKKRSKKKKGSLVNKTEENTELTAG